jgi:predicted Zn-dependent protease
MKTYLIITSIIFSLLLYTNGQTERPLQKTDDSEVAKTEEYKAIRIAELKHDWNPMMANARVLVAKFPQSPLAYRAMSDANYDVDSLIEAEVWARKAIQINQKDPIAWYDLGNILQKEDKLKEAQLAFKTSTDCQKDIPLVWAELSLLYSGLGKGEGLVMATKCANYGFEIYLNEIISDKFNDYNGETPKKSTLDQLALAHLYLKDIKNTLWLINKSIEIGPSNYSYEILSTACELNGDHMGALDAAQNAVKLNPDSSSAKKQLQLITGRIGLSQQQALLASQILKNQAAQQRQILEMAMELQQQESSRKSHGRSAPATQTPDDLETYRLKQQLYFLQMEQDRQRSLRDR